MKLFTQLNSWAKLQDLGQAQLSTLYNLKNSEFLPETQSIDLPSLSLNFSHQNISTSILDLLLDLAKERRLEEKIKFLNKGMIVNYSEQRPALHTALRTQTNAPIFVSGVDILPEILAAKESMRVISQKIRTGGWYGYSGKPIKDIVNIGMGGSDFGARFCIHALDAYCSKDLGYHFISDIDPNSFANTVLNLNPETTLFIISSKSFTTQETLANAKKAFAWIGNSKESSRHFIAITANNFAARNFGIDNILPIWDWIGGRYSLCSAINLITCIAIGYERFLELLKGAYELDKHFQEANFEDNIPVIMALIGVWNINFLHISNLLVWVYSNQLEYFVPYLQQLDMESNGKSIDNQGRTVNFSTSPIVWGGLGNQAQHSYYQLLCQGTHKVAADFICLREFANKEINSLCQAKIKVLSQGIPNIHSNSFIAGGLPINQLYLDDCSPFSLGQLIATYEHKIFTQGVIWNINSFDQPGVESAKLFRDSKLSITT